VATFNITDRIPHILTKCPQMKKGDVANRYAGSLTSVWCKDERYLFVFSTIYPSASWGRGVGTSGKNQRMLSGSR